MSDKYYTCLVKLNKDDLKEWLTNYYDEEEVENMSEYELQSQATQAIDGILQDHFSDFVVIDKDTVVLGDF